MLLLSPRLVLVAHVFIIWHDLLLFFLIFASIINVLRLFHFDHGEKFLFFQGWYTLDQQPGANL